MSVTSEDPINVNSAPATEADKPKRGRKRKVDTTQPAAPVDSAALIHTPEETAPAPSASTVESPEEYGAAMALENVPQHAAPILSGSGCGNVLKAAREAQGMSIHEVSGQLRLGVKQIQAIEQDDFEKLPQPSIVRGFIRNYARLLEIDVAPILEAYQRIVPSKAPLPLSVRSNASPSVIDKPVRAFRPQRILTLLIFLILAGIMAYFYINHIKPQAFKNASLALDVDNISETTGQEIAIPVEPAPQASTEQQLPLPEPATPVAIPSDTQATASPEAVPVPAPPVAAPAAVEDNPVPTTNTGTIVSTPTPASTGTTEATTLKAADPQKASLVFTVTEDSWVRIEDMQGKKLFSEVLKAGSEQTVIAAKPANIIVGHAGVTQLTIDNQPYDLTQATRGRVARIQLK